MDFIESLKQVELLYHQILALSLRQEACLSAGEVEALPGIAGEQMGLLARAEALLLSAGTAAGRADPAFQECLQRLAAVLAEVVASEERCNAFAPTPPAPTQPPPARVLAAYGKR